MIECIECSDFAERFVAYQCLHINRGCRLPHYTAIVKHIKTEKYIDTDVVVTKAGIDPAELCMSFLWHQPALFVGSTPLLIVGSSNSSFHKLVIS